MLAFKIGGKATLPPVPVAPEVKLNPPASTADAATTKKGEQLFARFCSACHGDTAVSGGVLPDLRYSKLLADEKWFDVVLGGTRKGNGMISFAKELSRKDAEEIRAYVILRANQSLPTPPK
jgi:alcohol dehydrogenase (cytochrome c)/quinohemoprotein ethanol dehydrogenase